MVDVFLAVKRLSVSDSEEMDQFLKCPFLLLVLQGFFHHLFVSPWAHWRAFPITFHKKADENQNWLPETSLASCLQEQLMPKVFLYLIICKCSALEQLALSPAREIIDSMK